MGINFGNEKVAKHKDLADKIKTTLEVENATISEKETRGAYLGNLPEGIDEKTVDKMADYNNKFVVASHVAMGELAADAFKADKSLEKVNAAVGYFGKRDKITATITREKTFTNNFAKTEEEKTLKKHLVMQSSINSSGHGLKSVREAMSEEFKDKFSK